MTPEFRMEIVTARTTHYNHVVRTALFVLTAVALGLVFAPGAFQLGLLLVTLVATAYGVLAGNTALDDLIALQSDMDEGFAATSYGALTQGRDLPRLKQISTVCIGGAGGILALLCLF